MWRQWATEDNTIKAAKRVGIRAKGLNVDDMQQEQFSHAAILMQTTNSTDSSPPSTPVKTRRLLSSNSRNIPSTPRSQSRVAKSAGRYGSAKYWKAMYEMSQNLMSRMKRV